MKCLTLDRHNEYLRKSFNALINETFGFDFETWYQLGHWTETYIPYIALDGDTVVANVSVNIQPMTIQSKEVLYIQLGAIATKKDYQNQGLSRLLMEKVLTEWEDKCDQIYLYANQQVVNFYPKFGFIPASEYGYSKDITFLPKKSLVEKLDLNQPNHLKLIKEKATVGNPFSTIFLKEGQHLTLFYLQYFMSDFIYYLPDLDTVIIAEYSDSTLHICEILGTPNTSLEDIIKLMLNPTVQKVTLGFTPKTTADFNIQEIKEEDTHFFILKSKGDPLLKTLGCFPELSHT